MDRVDTRWVVVVCVVGVASLASLGCARGTSDGPGGTPGFSLSYPEAPPSGVTARRGKRFYAKPSGQCFYDNRREARWSMSGARVITGELPPGLQLEDGVIGGVPTTPGTYTATIELGNVMCAGKPYSGQTVDVLITVK